MTRILYLMLTLLLSQLAFAQGSPIAVDRYPGGWMNKDIHLKLGSTSLVNFTYSGTLEFQGKTYPIVGRRAHADAPLEGEFTVDGTKFKYTAVTDGDRMKFSTGGVDHVLGREAAASFGGGGLFGLKKNPLGTPSSPGETSSPGRPYRHTTGLSFMVPAGWDTKDGPEGAILLPPGVTFNPGGAMDELYVAGSQVGSATDPKIAEEMQTKLGAQGAQFRQSVIQLGGRPAVLYAARMRDPKTGRPLAIQLYLVQDGDRANLAIGVGAAEGVERNDAGLRQVAATLRFQAPAAPVATAATPAAGGPLSDGSAAANQWVQRFRGMKLRQISTGQYDASSKTWILNADGSFSYAGDYSGAVYAPGGGSASVGNRSGGQGRWRVMGNTLELRFASGESRTYNLSSDGTKTFMNGVRTYVTGINE